MVSNDKPTSYKFFSFVGKVSFPLTALENFYFPLAFRSLTIICLGVDFFVYILFALSYFLNSVHLYLFSNLESFTLFLQAPFQAQSLSLLWFQWYIHVRVFNIIPQVSEALSIFFMLFSLFCSLFFNFYYSISSSLIFFMPLYSAIVFIYWTFYLSYYTLQLYNFCLVLFIFTFFDFLYIGWHIFFLIYFKRVCNCALRHFFHSAFIYLSDNSNTSVISMFISINLFQ